MSAAPAGHHEIDHTADVGFEAWAPDLPGLFVQATLALAELCYEPRAVRGSASRRLQVHGEGHEELLVRWLQEVYLQVETDRWLAAEVRAMQVKAGEATGELCGENLDRGRHTLHTEIKAVTYHGLAVRRDAGGTWRATVIVDV